MPGSLLNRARKDSKKYVTTGGFEENICIQTPDGLKSLSTTGFVSKHWINFDTDGNAANSKNAHICLDEDKLVLGNYPVRNLNQEVFLLKHRVTVKDSSGLDKKYVIIETFPNETLGLIVCILGDYGTN